MTRGEIWKDFFETYSFDLGNRTVSVFDLQVCLYQKTAKRNIFMSGSVAGFPLGFGECLSGWFPMDMT